MHPWFNDNYPMQLQPTWYEPNPHRVYNTNTILQNTQNAENSNTQKQMQYHPKIEANKN